MKEKIMEWLDLLIKVSDNTILRDENDNWISAFCSIVPYDDEIHISNVFYLADILDLTVFIVKRDSIDLPYKVSFRYKNHNFFMLLTKTEYDRWVNNENK